MGTLLETRMSYFNSEITKYEFVERAYEKYASLFECSELLTESLAEKIEITKIHVTLSLKNTGIKLTFVKGDKHSVPIAILSFGQYEEPLWRKTFELLNKPKMIFDIGANIGYFSLFCAKYFPSVKIFCFEPIPTTYSYLVKNIRLNHAGNIFPQNIGLTNSKQTLEMFYSPEISSASSLQNLLDIPTTEKIPCEFSTLDDFSLENNIERLDFIKCDVEGAEKFVYEGGIKTIEKFRPIVFSEMLRKWSAKFYYHPNEIIKLFRDLKYTCRAVTSSSMREISEVTDSTEETNYIFLPN